MPLYEYQAYTREGKSVTGTIDAGSEAEVRERLKGQNLIPSRLTQSGSASGSFSLSSLFAPRIDAKTKIVFTKQFALLMRSGVPLVQSFDLMIEQFEGKFKNILITIRDGIKAGEALADQLVLYPQVFPTVYVQLVKAGEASGKLDEILGRLTEYLEKSEETRKKINSAFSGPISMLFMIFGVVALMLTLVVPRMSEMFTKMGKELPVPTQILMTTSDFVLGNLWLIAGSLIVAIVAFLRWRSSASGKRVIDQMMLKIPMFSYFSKTRAVVQFCSTLGMLIESGVNLSEALEIVIKIVDNGVLVEKLKEARDNIIKEGKIASYLEKTGVFPKIASYMIKTGEESGKLGEMLITVGKDYDVELMEITESLTAKIDPVMRIILTLIVLFIIAAIFLPIVQMGDMSGL